MHVLPTISHTGLWRHLQAATQLSLELIQNTCLEIFDLGPSYAAGPLDMPAVKLRIDLSRYHDVAGITSLVEMACRELRPALIHTYHLFSDVYAARAAHHLRLGVVRTVAGVSQASWTNPHQRSPSRTRWDPADIAEELAVEPFVRQTLAVSEATRQMLCGYGFDPGKVSVSYLGTQVDVAPHPRAVRQESTNSPITIGFPHRLEPVKVGPAIVPALARVIGAGVPVRLVLVRTGRLFDFLRMRALKLGAEVVSVPVTPDLWHALPPLDCVVLASVSEGLPLVLIEAMARGIPVIASRVGGVEEAITDGASGLLFNCDDAPQLARHILSVARHSGWASMLGDAGRQVVRCRFDGRRHLLDLAACYRRIAAQQGGKT